MDRWTLEENDSIPTKSNSTQIVIQAVCKLLPFRVWDTMWDHIYCTLMEKDWIGIAGSKNELVAYFRILLFD